MSQRRERLIKRLRVPKTRARESAVLVEGVRAATEALDAGVEVSFAVLSPRLEALPAGAELARRLDEDHDAVRVEEAALQRLSDTERAQGVLLVCAEPEADLNELDAPGRYLLLDGVQDPGNAGTLVRAAVAFGMDAVVCLDGTVDPWGAKPVRASAGMVFRVPIVRASSADTLARLRELGVPLLVGDAQGEDIRGFGGRGAFAIAMGNEGRGVRPALTTEAAAALAVPMIGPAESLNVAMAGSILLHALTRGPTGE